MLRCPWNTNILGLWEINGPDETFVSLTDAPPAALV